MMTKRICLILVSLVLLPTGLLGESARERRHAEIRRKLEANSQLQYPYFAPSVHIRYAHPDPDKNYLAYYNEIQVTETVRHTYFCTIGFDVGYLGVQDHQSGPLVIFSVWDKGGGKNDSNAVDEEDQTRVLFTNPGGKSSRFGGEGSGAKTMMPFKWEVGETYSFLVLLTPRETGTVYTAWVAPEGRPFEKIASYQTVVTKKELRGFYSFIEDYSRNGETGQKKRLAYYPNQAAMTSKGEWMAVSSASGSIGDDIIQNGHSGVRNGKFYSESGADASDYASVPQHFEVGNAKLPASVEKEIGRALEHRAAGAAPVPGD